MALLNDVCAFKTAATSLPVRHSVYLQATLDVARARAAIVQNGIIPDRAILMSFIFFTVCGMHTVEKKAKRMGLGGGFPELYKFVKIGKATVDQITLRAPRMTGRLGICD